MKLAWPVMAFGVLTLVISCRAQSVHSDIESTARLIDVQSELADLQRMAAATGPIDKWQVLWLHQQISEQVMAASLQVDATMAQIDNEISRAGEIRSYLADRRDSAVNRANLLSILIGGGLGATSSALQLSSNLSRPGSAVGIGAGTISAGLALAGIRAQKGRRSEFAFESNMLAEFFDRPALPNSHYPTTVWTFLNQFAQSGEAALTRKEQLMKTWVQVGRLDSLDSQEKISRLTSEPSEQRRLSIDDFEDRAAMLQDVRARISFLKRDLGVLLSALPPVTRGGR